VNVILIDYNSTDGNYQEIMKKSNLKHNYLNPIRDEEFMNAGGKGGKNASKFSKVKALNYGIRHVRSSDSIVFILDLHLQLPLNIFDRIRKVNNCFFFHIKKGFSSGKIAEKAVCRSVFLTVKKTRQRRLHEEVGSEISRRCGANSIV